MAAALMVAACVDAVGIQAQKMAMASSLGAAPASQRLLQEPAVEMARWARAIPFGRTSALAWSRVQTVAAVNAKGDFGTEI